MQVFEVNQKDWPKYNKFVFGHPLGSIHQIREWGEFQSKNPPRDRFWIFAAENENGQIAASALIVRQKLPFNKCWLYSPRGPVCDFEDSKILKLLFEKIASLAQEQNAIFFRFDPPLKIADATQKNIPDAKAHPEIAQINSIGASSDLASKTICLAGTGAIPAHASYQPESTLILDLNLSEEKLLAQMKPKGRYNIKIAQKHGVLVHLSENPHRDIKTFYKLLKQTTQRGQFSAHPLLYYENMFSIFSAGNSVAPLLKISSSANSRKKARAQGEHTAEHKLPNFANAQVRLYLAEYKNTSVAAIIVTWFKDTATYYFGASGNQYRNIMAPYLLQWQAIIDAKKAGFRHYDFLGIAPEDQPNHPWAGVSDFKLKFGGSRVNYLPAREIVYQPFWYNLMKLAKRFIN